jgi:hypothetical protein
MNLKTKTILFLFVALAFFSFQKNVALAGFGISPPSIVNKDLVPGSSYNKDIYLLQSASDSDLNVAATVDAGKISDWIKIGNGNNFVITKGTQKFPMTVSINVPADAKSGEYKGTINLKTSPVGNQQAGVSVNIATNITLDLTVSSKEVSSFSIQNFQIPDVASGTPISLVMKVKNEGNVESGPTKASITFFDQYHSKQLGQQDVPITEKVNSFETKDISVAFINNLVLGSYWADVKIYNNDKAIVDSKVVFAVVSQLPVTANENEKANSSAMWMYVLIAIIIVLGALFFAKKQKAN